MSPLTGGIPKAGGLSVCRLARWLITLQTLNPSALRAPPLLGEAKSAQVFHVSESILFYSDTYHWPHS